MKFLLLRNSCSFTRTFCRCGQKSWRKVLSLEERETALTLLQRMRDNAIFHKMLQKETSSV